MAEIILFITISIILIYVVGILGQINEHTAGIEREVKILNQQLSRIKSAFPIQLGQ